MKDIKTGEPTPTERATKSIRIYLKELSAYGVLEPEEEYELFLRMKGGDEKAKEKIVKHNLKFVVSVAKKFYNIREIEKYYDLMDLICEGNMALWIAVDKFDHTRGFKFISYGVRCIQGAIYNFLNTTKFFRIPQNKHEIIKAALIISNKIEQKEGRDIGFHEVVHEISDDPKYAELLMSTYALMISEKENIRIESLVPDTNSKHDLEFSLSDDEKIEERYADQIANPGDFFQPDYKCDRESLFFNIRCSTSTLTSREQDVIWLHFGLDGDNPLSFEQIGERFDLTKNRVREINTKAIRRLKHEARRNIIKSSYNGTLLMHKECDVLSNPNRYGNSSYGPLCWRVRELEQQILEQHKEFIAKKNTK